MSHIDLWANHEARILEIVTLALKMLITELDLPENEDRLNRKLFFCIHRANRQLVDANKHLDWPLTYEARNQPDADDSVRALREGKRPDFIWAIYDHLEPDPEKSAKYFVLECKRLGTPPYPGYKLNVNYIKTGINRFVLAEWGYGKSCRSGIMIGYAQSMEMEDILKEVNTEGSAHSLSGIELSSKPFITRSVNRLEQELHRPEVLPTPFSLRHLWVDLRR
jgi:hypothetical protein